MRWKKLGRLYCPSNSDRHPKLLTHAANPLPILIEGDIYRIYFSGRDAQNRSSVGAVDIDIIKRKIIQEYTNPFFEHGSEGSFYADGVSIGNCYEVDGMRYMLFMGWQNPENEHWHGNIGRLLVDDNLSLHLDGEITIKSANTVNHVSLSYPWVNKNEMQGYQMWYGTTKTWDAGNGEMLHVINHAFSNDGFSWSCKGLAIPYELGIMQAFSRPSVIGSSTAGYEMWFSYRGGAGETYRIGYAVSSDGEKWEVLSDQSGIDVSATGWDSEMIEYPFVFEHKNKKYLLYNGNDYGKTGFGLAILEQDK